MEIILKALHNNNKKSIVTFAGNSVNKSFRFTRKNNIYRLFSFRCLFAANFFYFYTFFTNLFSNTYLLKIVQRPKSTCEIGIVWREYNKMSCLSILLAVNIRQAPQGKISWNWFHEKIVKKLLIRGEPRCQAIILHSLGTAILLLDT